MAGLRSPSLVGVREAPAMKRLQGEVSPTAEIEQPMGYRAVLGRDFVCACVHMYVPERARVCSVSVYTRVHRHVVAGHVCSCVQLYLGMCVHVCACVWIYLCIYTCACVYVCV